MSSSVKQILIKQKLNEFILHSVRLKLNLWMLSSINSFRCSRTNSNPRAASPTVTKVLLLDDALDTLSAAAAGSVSYRLEPFSYDADDDGTDDSKLKIMVLAFHHYYRKFNHRVLDLLDFL
jgi:hypothetical protein